MKKTKETMVRTVAQGARTLALSLTLAATGSVWAGELADAIANAQEGATITLSAAVTEEDAIVIDKDLTIDFNGNAATLNGGIEIGEGKTLTVTRANASGNVIPTITGGGNLVVSGSNTFNWKGMAGASSLASITQDNASGGITIAGYGTINVTGVVAVNATLTLTPSGYSEVAADTHMINLNATSVAAGTLNGAAVITTTDGVAANTGSFSGTIAGEGGLAANGTSGLTLSGLNSFDGALNVGENANLTISSSLDGISTMFRLDASDEDSIVVSDDNYVTNWLSQVNNYSFSKDESVMTLTTDYFGGKKAVRSNKSTLNSSFTVSSSRFSSSIIAAVRLVEAVNAGGSMILGANGTGNYYIGRRGTGSDQASWKKMNGSKNENTYGFWQSGVYGDRTYHTDKERTLVALNWSRNANMTTEYIGGGASDIVIAEIIGFDRTNPDIATIKRIEAYLANKWGMTDMGTYLPAADVTIATGGVLDLGGTTQTIASLSGSGTVQNGSLIVTDAISVPAGNTLVIPYGSTYSLEKDGTYDVVNTDAGTVTITHRAADIDGTPYDTVQGAVDAYESGTLTIYESAELSLTKSLTISGVVLENDAELTFAETVPFTSSYEDGTISCVRNVSMFVYEGPETFTVDAANFTVDGKTASVIPEATDTIQFDTAVTIDPTAASYQYAAVVVNANVKLNGGASHYLYSDSISGTGKLSLENDAMIATYSGKGTISCELEVNASSSNPAYLYVADGGREITVEGVLSGAGYLKCTKKRNVSYSYSGNTFKCSDASGFSGTIEMVHPGGTDVGRNLITFYPCDLSSATIIVGNYSGSHGRIIDGQSNSAVYKFGSFSGYVSPSASSVGDSHPIIEIGALGKDDTVTGNWMPNSNRNPTIRKVGTGTFTTSAINAHGYILNGGTLVVMAGAEADVTTEVSGATVNAVVTYDSENPETVLYTTYTLIMPGIDPTDPTSSQTVTPTAEEIETYGSAEDAAKALATVAVPAAAEGYVDAPTYKSYFTLSATAGEGGAYTVTITGLDEEEVVNPVEESAIAALQGDGTVTVKTGLYYGFVAGNSPSLAEPAEYTLATGTTMTVDKSAITETGKGFVKVVVSATPKK